MMTNTIINYRLRYFNCQGTQEPTGGWCGPGMAFDTEKERCDMASAVNCKEGDRPDWKPPENCNNREFKMDRLKNHFHE